MNAQQWETIELHVCTDCLMMLANGDVGDRGPIGALSEYVQHEDDAHLYELPGDDAQNNANTRHAARMRAMWPAPWDVVPASSDESGDEFSWSACDGCGTRLGGTRHAATAMRRAEVDA